MWDTSTGKKLDSTKLVHSEHGQACEFSPDGTLLLATDATDLQLYQVADDDGQLSDEPLDVEQRSTISGLGETTRRVAFANDDSYRLALVTQPNAVARVNNFARTISDASAQAFDLKKLELSMTFPEGVAWRGPRDSRNGWSVTPTNDNTRMVLLHNDQRRGVIDLDRTKQGFVNAWCWIPGRDDQPAALALGTVRQYGVYIYSLPDEQGRCELIRYFRDHNGDVLSLSASPDGKYLASSATDQTVRIWSLDGLLDATDDRAERSRAWGGQFVFADAHVVLKNIHPAGILAGRSYEDGDVIAAVATYGPDGNVLEATTANDILRLVRRTDIPIYQPYRIDALRDGQPLALRLVVPAWEPLLTLFVDRRGEWALWSPEGYYDASVGEGNELFGWQINRGADATPRVLKAAELQKEFHRPDVIRRLLAAGSVRAAMLALNQPPPPDVRNRAGNLARALPELDIEQPQSNARLVAGQNVQLVARIKHANPLTVNDFEVRGSVNGRPLGPPQVLVQDDSRIFTWNATVNETLNRFRVRVEERDANGVGLFDVDEVAVRAANVTPTKYRLHLLTFAVGDYRDNGAYDKLEFPVADADSLRESIQKKAGDYYDIQRVWKYKDSQVTRDGVQRIIGQVRRSLENANEQDVLVVFLAGHGDAPQREYFYIPSTVTSDDPQVLQKQAISGQVLLQLADLPCRKLVFLDTCHSGSINASVTKITGTGIERFKTRDFMVVAATSVGENAREGGLLFKDHGAFTHTILAGLDGAADGAGGQDADGRIGLMELVTFVQKQVPRITLRQQRPTFTPASLFQDVNLFLVRRKKTDK